MSKHEPLYDPSLDLNRDGKVDDFERMVEYESISEMLDEPSPVAEYYEAVEAGEFDCCDIDEDNTDPDLFDASDDFGGFDF